MVQPAVLTPLTVASVSMLKALARCWTHPDGVCAARLLVVLVVLAVVRVLGLEWSCFWRKSADEYNHLVITPTAGKLQ